MVKNLVKSRFKKFFLNKTKSGKLNELLKFKLKSKQKSIFGKM